MSAAKPQRNTNKRLYWQLIAPLKTANVPEPFHNQLDETEINSVHRNRKESKKCAIRELAVMQNQWCSGGYTQVYGVYPLLYQLAFRIPTSKFLRALKARPI